MRLMGRDISGDELLGWVEERLALRGLRAPDDAVRAEDGDEAPVDPLSFNLAALEAHADAARPLPEVGRSGLPSLARRVFRVTCQAFIDEVLGRQTAFNGHVRDSYAQLSAEVLKLRERVAELEGGAAPPPPRARARAKKGRAR